MATKTYDEKKIAQLQALQDKYHKLLAMAREGMGYLISLNGDLNYDQISNLVERFEEFDC